MFEATGGLREQVDQKLHLLAFGASGQLKRVKLYAGIKLAGLNLCVWAKSNAGMGSLYRSQHELVAVFKKGIPMPQPAIA